MNAPYLPPIAQPPHDPLTRVLDARLGWSGLEVPGFSSGVEAAPEDGALALAPLTGSGRQLAEPAGSLGGLVLPRHAAWLADGQLVLLDVSAPRLLVLDRCDCSLRRWPCLAANDPRLPAAAVAIAAGCGVLLVCAPSQHRVIVLDAASGALRGVWPSPAGAPPWTPVHAVLLDGGMAAVADPARGGVHLCSRRGRSLRFIGGLGAVGALAVDGHNRLLVVRDGSAEVLRIDLASGQVTGAFTRPADVAHAFAPLPVEVAADGAIDIAPLCDCADVPWWIGRDGQPLAAPPVQSANAYPLTGTWLSQALDSEIAGCVWDRITLTASLPAGTRLRLWSAASDALLTEPELAEPSRWQRAGEWLQPASEADLDCAAQDWMLHATRGRHGWIRIEFAGDTRSTPRLHCASIDFARTPLSRYLPTVFAADPVAAEFGDRWLGIFDRALREVESQVDDQARLFDPLATPAAPEVPAAQDFLHFLAGWVGVVLPTAWPLDRQRHVLAQAPRLYPWRGTREGLTASLRLLLGLDRWDDHVPARSGLRALRAADAATLAQSAAGAGALHAAALDGAGPCAPVRRRQAVGRAHRQPQPTAGGLPAGAGRRQRRRAAGRDAAAHAPGPASRPVPCACAPHLGVRPGRLRRGAGPRARARAVRRRRGAGPCAGEAGRRATAFSRRRAGAAGPGRGDRRAHAAAGARRIGARPGHRAARRRHDAAAAAARCRPHARRHVDDHPLTT